MATFITPVDVTPSTSGAWVDVDVSAYIPVGATGVILHIVNADSTTRVCACRKNGSTDTYLYTTPFNTHLWVSIGVDANRIFENYNGNVSYVKVWLVGYYGSEAVFFTNSVDKTPGSIDSWVDVDISSDTGADTAIGAILMASNSSGTVSTNFGCRKNGSTDARYNLIGTGYKELCAIIGVDNSEIFEAYIGSISDAHVHLIGYIKSGATFNINATDISLSTTGSWLDLAALPAGALGGIIEITQSGTSNYGLRKNGSAEIISRANDRHSWGIIECDASGVIEGNISSTTIDFFLIGYFIASSLTISPSGIATAEAFGSPTLTPGAVTISPTGIATAEVFGTPTITQSGFTLSPTGISSAEIFGTISIQPGAVAVIPSGIVTAEVFGVMAALPGVVTILPFGIAPAEAVGTPAIALGIIPIGIPGTEVFGSITIQPGIVTASPVSIAGAEVFGTPVITIAGITLYPAGITTAEVFGSALLATGPVIVFPIGIASTSVFGTPMLQTGAVTVLPPGIASPESFGTPAIATGLVIFYPSGIATTEAIGTPAVQSGAASVSPSGITSAGAFGVAALTPGAVIILPFSTVSTEIIGVPTLTIVAIIPDVEIYSVSVSCKEISVEREEKIPGVEREEKTLAIEVGDPL